MQFIGSVRVELSSWEGEIVFTAGNRLQAREYDRLVGRIAQGEKALKRIIERSREPMGRINVVRAEPKETAAHLRKAFVDERITSKAREVAFGRGDTAVDDLSRITRKPVKAPDRETVALAGELISTVKEPFDRAKMDFETAFNAACSAMYGDRPWLVSIRDGEMKVAGEVRTGELFDAVAASLSHIINNLRGDARFGKLLIYTRHRLQQHFSARHADYSRLGLVETVDRILA